MKIVWYICSILFLIGVMTGTLAKWILKFIETCRMRKDAKENERNQVSERIEKVEEADQ